MPSLPSLKWLRKAPVDNRVDIRNVVVVRRQSPDWDDPVQVYDQIAAFERLIERPAGSIRRLIDQWDRTAGLSFAAFRSRVARIARSNLARLPGIDVIGFESYRRRQAAGHEIYAFIDDDDWYAPHLPAELIGAPIEGAGVTWRPAIFRGNLLQSECDGACATNNYVIRGSALAQSSKLRRVAEQHFTLDAAVARRKIKLDQWDRVLSLTNKHPASSVILERAVEMHGDAGVRWEIDRTKVRLNYVVDWDAHGLGWASVEIEAMRQLIHEL